MKLCVVTPCSRPENLPLLLESIEAAAPKGIEWQIFHDTATTKLVVNMRSESVRIHNELYEAGTGWGHAARNDYLDYNSLDVVDDHLLYFLDDDNLIHWSFWPSIERLARDTPDAGMYAFAQETAPHKFRAPDIRPCRIDLAQVVFRRSFIGDKRFKLHYEADSELIAELHDADPSRVHVSQQVMSYYNRLKW